MKRHDMEKIADLSTLAKAAFYDKICAAYRDTREQHPEYSPTRAMREVSFSAGMASENAVRRILIKRGAYKTAATKKKGGKQ